MDKLYPITEDMEKDTGLWSKQGFDGAKFSNELYGLLMALTEDDGEATPILMNEESGRGLEVWRRFIVEFGQKTEATDQMLLDKLTAWPACTSIDQIPSALEKWRATYAEFVKRTKTDLGSHFKISGLKKVVTDKIRRLIEDSTTPMSYAQMEDFVKKQVESHRANKANAMDIGAVEA